MRNSSIRGKALLVGLIITITAASVSAEGTQVYPLVKYDYTRLNSQGLHSPGIGLLALNNQNMLTGFYTRHSFTDSIRFETPQVYHSIDLLFDGGSAQHRLLYLFKSEAEEPAIGGFQSFQTAAVYGYRLVHNQRASLVLGGGLAVSDFGIELEDGRTWPLIPVPLIRFSYESTAINAKFDFITGPNLCLTLMPEQHFRISGDFRMDQFRDIQDLVFELTLKYRFFDKHHPMGDFAGIEVGVKNEAFSFDITDQDEPFELNYYSLFATLDATLLKASGGYIYKSRERYAEDETNGLGEGFFLSIEGMYQF